MYLIVLLCQNKNNTMKVLEAFLVLTAATTHPTITVFQQVPMQMHRDGDNHLKPNPSASVQDVVDARFPQTRYSLDGTWERRTAQSLCNR